jgi:hypothetical protein
VYGHIGQKCILHINNVTTKFMKKLLRVITMHKKNKWTKEEINYYKIKQIVERQNKIDYLLNKIKPKPLPQEFFILEKE